jgi:ribonuclease HI
LTSTPRFGVFDLPEFTARMASLRLELQPPQAPGAFVAYTDGACFGNPAGPGGWAAVFDDAQLWGHLTSTTNNRAEALGVLAALEWVPPGSRLSVYSDSELTVRVLQGRYRAKANPDIWDVIFRTRLEKRLELEYEWVRGHAGDLRNELADQLSKLGARNGVYVDEPPPPPVPRELQGLVPQGDWEREFLSSIADQLRRKRPLSAKQQAVIDRIRARRAAPPA